VYAIERPVRQTDNKYALVCERIFKVFEEDNPRFYMQEKKAYDAIDKYVSVLGWSNYN
jgi:5-bromo-4-chloroindolyl phosphate hydrolysis protein